jgi:hypothetical protein
MNEKYGFLEKDSGIWSFHWNFYRTRNFKIPHLGLRFFELIEERVGEKEHENNVEECDQKVYIFTSLRRLSEKDLLNWV